MRVGTGLSRISRGEPEALRHVRGRRVGLLAHPASIDESFVHAEQVLTRAGAELCAIFGPEHGYTGQAQDMIGVAGGVSAGPPVYSLYGESFAQLSPEPAWLSGLDAVVIDLQDVGSRYYTFVWSAALMLIACARQGVHTIVLDRPNPLGGTVMEGAPQRPGYRSFVGLYDVPVRHGLTLAEVCTMVRELEGLDEQALTVLPMQGWSRHMLWTETGVPWVLPSPNMPTPETALVYPGGCLIEGTNLSEGRGTTRPFEIWGAPFIDAARLASGTEAAGAALRPLSFEPTFHKHARSTCGGLQVHVTDARMLRSYRLYRELLARVAAASRHDFRWRTETYEYVSDRPAIDLLTGGPEYREAVDRGDELEPLFMLDEEGVRQFAERRRPWLLY